MAIEEVGHGMHKMVWQALTNKQEFSIEIPDKEADAIHSGMSIHQRLGDIETDVKQSTKPWTTSWLSLTVCQNHCIHLTSH